MAEYNSEMVGYLKKSIGQHKEAFCVYMEQHAHMELWGYPRLAKCFKKAAKGKAKHIEILQERLEYFDQGDAEPSEKIEWPRHNLQGIIEVDLKMEEAIDKLAGYAKAKGVSVGIADPVTANKFTKIARTSEEAIAKLQAILSVIDETSIKMYKQNANLD